MDCFIDTDFLIGGGAFSLLALVAFIVLIFSCEVYWRSVKWQLVLFKTSVNGIKRLV